MSTARAPGLELLHRLLNVYRFGGRLAPVRVLLRSDWRGPRVASFLPGLISISAAWYAYHRRAYGGRVTLLLLHEMAHQAAREAGEPDGAADHGPAFWRYAPPGTPAAAPLAPGYPAGVRYRCPAGHAYRAAFSTAARCPACGGALRVTARRARPPRHPAGPPVP